MEILDEEIIEEETAEEIEEEMEADEPQGEETDVEPLPTSEEESEETTEDEFDEIVYLGEKVKLPVKERTDYLQKGYNHDRMKEKLGRVESEVNEFKKIQQEISALYGMDFQEAYVDIKRQLMEAKAEEQNIPIEAYEKIVQLEILNKQLAEEKREREVDAQKGKLRNQRFFKELETEIDGLLRQAPDWTVEGAFIYLKGLHADELLDKEVSSKTKSDIADKQRDIKRGVSKSSAPKSSGKEWTPQQREWAEKMGVKL